MQICKYADVRMLLIKYIKPQRVVGVFLLRVKLIPGSNS
jgi:hypothetical protein